MNLENIKRPHPDAAEGWNDFVAEVAAVEGGLDFIDWVETKVADKNFYGAVTVDVDTENAFAEAAFYVAANALRAGEFTKVAANIDTDWL